MQYFGFLFRNSILKSNQLQGRRLLQNIDISERLKFILTLGEYKGRLGYSEHRKNCASSLV